MTALSRKAFRKVIPELPPLPRWFEWDYEVNGNWIYIVENTYSIRATFRRVNKLWRVEVYGRYPNKYKGDYPLSDDFYALAELVIGQLALDLI